MPSLSTVSDSEPEHDAEFDDQGGADELADHFEAMGMHPPKAQAYAAALSETIGGGLTAAGLLNPLGPSMIIGTMAVAIQKVHGKNGVWVTKGGFEYNLVLIAAATLTVNVLDYFEDTLAQVVALALFVGMISGAYSSIFIATPLLAQLKEREPDMRRHRARVENRRGKTEARDEAQPEPVEALVGVAGDEPAAVPVGAKGGTRVTTVSQGARSVRPVVEGAAKRPQPQSSTRSQRKK